MGSGLSHQLPQPYREFILWQWLRTRQANIQLLQHTIQETTNLEHIEEITRQLVARDIEVLDELRKEEKRQKEEEEAEGARDGQPVGHPPSVSRIHVHSSGG